MSKIYKVFISSTFEDLREERAEVQKALLKLNCLPVGMELFPAADNETWEFIKAQISDSDYYVVLIAGRYGSSYSDGVSFTEKEFDFAVENQKPAIGFIHGDRSAISVKKSERDADRSERLTQFIAKVQARPVRYFTTPHQLALEVTTSFIDLVARRPAIGYVRADQTADFKKYSEILEKNQELSQKLQEIDSSAAEGAKEWFSQDVTLRVSGFHGRDDSWREATVTWGAMIIAALPMIAGHEEEKYIFQHIAFCALNSQVGATKIDEGEKYACILDEASEQTIRTVVSMSGLISVTREARSTYNHMNNQNDQYFPLIWKVTERGRGQISILMGRKVL